MRSPLEAEAWRPAQEMDYAWAALVLCPQAAVRVQEQSSAFLAPAVRCVENLQSLGKELQAVNAHRERSSAGPEEVR